MMDSAQIMRQALQAGRFDALQNEAYSTQQTNQAAAQSGQVMGFTLQVMEDPLQELQDSMEELSFQFEEKEMKTAGERKLGELKGPRSAYVTAVQEWMKTLPDMPGGAFMERMLRQLRQIQQAGQAFTSRDFLRLLGQGSEDPSHQFAMLDAMERALGHDETELQKLFAAAKQHLTETKGAEIRAGINLAETINAQAKTPEEMQDLRNLYRSETIGFKTPQDCFRSLLATRGAGGLAGAIEFLVKGCGIDLQSPSPSQSPEELRRILGDLQAVQVLRTVLDSAEALVGKMMSQFGETSLLDGEKLCGRILDFTEMPFVNAGNVAALLTSCGLGQLLAKIYFNTTLIDIFRGLSPRLFEDENGRLQLENAAQENLDGLVEKQSAEDERRQKGAA